MKKIIKTMLIAAMFVACTVTAYASSSELEGYPVTVSDWDTPAVFAAGKDWPITTWYLYAGDGSVLGSIPNWAVMEIAKQHPSGSVQWETWLADAFNEYRQSEQTRQDSGSQPHSEAEQAEEKEPAIETAPPAAEPEQPDAEVLALEAFGLINEARAENGLQELEPDEDAMSLAKMRVPELEELYDHTRPDGSRMSRAYRCGEIINRRASTPQTAVESWMDSPAHREMILAERYHSAGIACWKGVDGVTYWCILFYK